MNIRQVDCEPFTDQRPGTAGLRKKVTDFQQPDYLECFVQSVIDIIDLPAEATIVLGGDGRYYNRQAIQIIVAMAAANGIGKILIGKGGLLSTPAASHMISNRSAGAGIILTASHNPGGPNGDFGLKFNTATGGQAPEQMTDAVFERSKEIQHYYIADIPELNLDKLGITSLGALQVEVIDPVSEYAELMEELFDFELIRSALKTRISLHFDALNAATGPYAKRIFCDMLGAPETSVHNAVPLEDFGGLHPDPNPVDAAHLVKVAMAADSPDLIAASDGDGDRNMILGHGMVVSPGDSLAILLANTDVAPGYRSGVTGVARSMPTSRAVDTVAENLGIPCYETPTGWRFFCNLLEANKITLCGEESFGTSSSHTREKDGLWAVLFWLNIMASLEQPVEQIVRNHWLRFGRCYFQRRDYFTPAADRAADMLAALSNKTATLVGSSDFGPTIVKADVFSYTDPIDGSVSANQGVRIYFEDGGRIVFRLSGTGTAGATLRVYLDKLENDSERLELPINDAVGHLAQAAAEIAEIESFINLKEATAIIG